MSFKQDLRDYGFNNYGPSSSFSINLPGKNSLVIDVEAGLAAINTALDIIAITEPGVINDIHKVISLYESLTSKALLKAPRKIIYNKLRQIIDSQNVCGVRLRCNTFIEGYPAIIILDGVTSLPPYIELRVGDFTITTIGRVLKDQRIKWIDSFEFIIDLITKESIHKDD